ncbi:MAG: hypothetical protein QOF02_3394 [Blastocatellia bacterium]|jgi:hypothetical protein|nr:hypothetical protein [Blastocatellia bacterium]
MSPKRQRAASAIALLLVFSLSQVFVQATLAGKNLAVKNAAATNPARTGKLTTRGNNPISLNGISTNSGTTVLPGAQLLTPANVGASVVIGRIGLLRMAPESSLTLNFNDKSVDIILNSGYATLTTAAGVKGTIATPDGKTASNDTSKLSTIEAQTGNDDDDKKKAGGYLLGSGEEGEGLLGGISNSSARAFGLIVLGGAIGATIFIVTNGRGDNPSTATP